MWEHGFFFIFLFFFCGTPLLAASIWYGEGSAFRSYIITSTYDRWELSKRINPQISGKFALVYFWE